MNTPGTLALLTLGLLVLAPAAQAQEEPLEGFRFLPERAALYVPARPLAERLGLQLKWRAGSLFVSGQQLPQEDQEVLPDGAAVVQARALPGVTSTWDPVRKRAELKLGERSVEVVPGATVTDGVTFWIDGGRALYVPLQEAAEALDLPSEWEAQSGRATLAGQDLSVRELLDGTPLLDVESLARCGAEVQLEDAFSAARREGRSLWVRKAAKRVAIHLEEQRMRAWQGRRLVFDSNVSTGARGMETPQGLFTAGPIKGRMLISRKYGNAEMPWATQVRGNVLIHGSKSVPPHAASHGCIRVPLTGRNPARWFYEWVSLGTPIQIDAAWPKEWPVDQP